MTLRAIASFKQWLGFGPAAPAALPALMTAANDSTPMPLAGAGARRAGRAQGSWCIREEAIMGTAIRVELWSADRAQGDAAAAAVIDEMHRIDLAMSPHKPASELSRINRDAAKGPVAISAEMCTLLDKALRFSELSQGAFDITYAAVGHLFDYRSGIKPADAALEAARAGIGWRHLQLDAARRTLRFLHPRTRIDLGGFAKGHAVDNAIRLLQRRGIEHAYVSAGGDSRVLGDRRGRPWNIAIRDPRRAGEIVAVLPLVDCAVSTSGDYERFFEQGGERHHHIIDPATGASPRGVRSVSVLADDGLTAEAMSKTVFVLGPERGLDLVRGQPGVDVVIVDAQGQLHVSEGLRARPDEPTRR